MSREAGSEIRAGVEFTDVYIRDDGMCVQVVTCIEIDTQRMGEYADGDSGFDWEVTSTYPMEFCDLVETTEWGQAEKVDGEWDVSTVEWDTMNLVTGDYEYMTRYLTNRHLGSFAEYERAALSNAMSDDRQYGPLI